MNHKFAKAGFTRQTYGGFTLLEILLAVTIIAAIVSMVYGSYIATIRSIEAYEATIAVSQNTRAALAQITRQIRCAYVPQSLYVVEGSQKAFGNSKLPPKLDGVLSEEMANYFSGNAESLNGEVLHLVTTAGRLEEPQSIYGLFEVAYRFDRNKGALFLSQQRFLRTPDSMTRSGNWQQVISGVENLELAFFDGQKWLNKWDFKDRRRPPYAVKINIICQDKNYRRCRYATLAYIPCQMGRDKKTASDTLVTVDKLWE